MINTEIRHLPHATSADRRNGHAEPLAAVQIAYIESLAAHYISVAEDAARKKQEKHLVKEMSASLNTNLEVWADHENEVRRLAHDIFTTWKRPTKEVVRYNQVLEKANGNEEALLFELIQNWTTPDNFEHIATLLSFSPNESLSLSLSLESNTLTEEVECTVQPLDKSHQWYPTLLEVLSVDDIIPLVIIRKLLLEGKVKPSLKHIYVGLKRYFDREMRNINDRSENDVAYPEKSALQKLARIAQLNKEKAKVLEALSKMDRSPRPPRKAAVYT
jgi:hypothetical protein